MTSAKLSADGFTRPIGVYVHFPWCLQKCPYCDFLSVSAERVDIPHRAYADRVIQEIERRRSEHEDYELKSVFFGGGTPSLWEPEELGRVLSAIRRAWPAADSDIEVTVECNPSSLDAARARALAEAGANRLSIGVQGLDDERLKFLGRLHDAAGGLSAIEQAKSEGRLDVSADLIFGVRGQSAEQAASEVARVADAGVGHLSAYALTIEPNTRFGALARQGRLPILSEDVQADAFQAVEQALESRGFQHYEISNYAQPGKQCEHNLGYWRGRDYLGVGCGAWGTLRTPRKNGKRASDAEARVALRYRNTLSPDRYLELDFADADLTRPGPAIVELEPLDAETLLKERILLGVRLSEGVDLAGAERELGVEVWTDARRLAVSRLRDAGKLTVVGDRLSIPKAYWIFADAIARELM